MSNKPANTKTDRPSENPHAKKQVQYNRRARHEYFIDETFDAGLELVGTEVKSIRQGKANIVDAFCKIQNGEMWIHGMHISPFEHGTHWNVEPVRPRKLLLHRREIDYVRGKMEQKGLALIPLALYFQHGFAKVELGLGRGKKLYDKRDASRKQEAQREIERSRGVRRD